MLKAPRTEYAPKMPKTWFKCGHVVACQVLWEIPQRESAWQPCASRAPLPLPRACLSVSPPRALRLHDRAPEPSTSFLTHSLDRCSLLASLRAACDRHGRAPSSPAPRCFPLLAPPSLLTSNAISFASLSCTPCSCSPSKTTLGALQSPAAVASDRRCSWPVLHRPPLGHPRPPASAGGHPGAPPPLHRRR